MSLPPEAVFNRGLLRIQLSPGELAYIAENILPDALGLDPLYKRVVVPDADKLAEQMVLALNREISEDGSTPIYRLIEDAMQWLFEQGEEGLEIEQIKREDNE